MNREPSPQAQYLYRPENLRPARTALAFLVFGGIFFYFIYSPALNVPFAHHDQYRFFREDFHRPTDLRERRTNDIQYEGLVGKGRPIAAEIEYNTFRNVTVIKDLSLFRCMTVILIAVSCTVLALWLRYLGFSGPVAFLGAGSIFTLPGIQNFVCMANIPNVLTIFLAVVASLLLYRLRVVLSFVVLLAAMFTYPTLSYVFLLPPLALVLFRKLDEWPETRRVVLMHFVVLALASTVFFIVTRYILSLAGAKVSEAYQVELTRDLLGKITWFTEAVSIWALNLWNIYARHGVAYATLIVLALGIAARGIGLWKREYFQQDRRKMMVYALQAVVLASALVLATNAPSVLMSSRLLLFRIILPYSAALVLAVLFSLKAIAETLPGRWTKGAVTAAFGAVFLGSAAYANFNINNNALNSYAETLFISSQLARHVDAGVKRIHVILPVSEGEMYKTGYNGLPQITDEFNMNSLNLPNFMVGIVRGALLQVMDRHEFVVIRCREDEDLEDCLKNVSDECIVVTYSETNKPIEVTPNTVVVNMNDLMRVSFDRNRTRVDSIGYSVDSANGPQFGAKNAFDSNLHTFWETTATRDGGNPFLHWIEIDFRGSPRTAKEYALQTGNHGIDGRDSTGRMPKDWRFEASNDGANWTVLDVQEDQTNWTVNERRMYRCNNSSAYRYYRLYITAGVNPKILRLYELRVME